VLHLIHLCFLSVPLPQSDSFVFEVTYVAAYDAEHPEVGVPKPISIKTTKYANVETIKDIIAKQTGVDAKELLVAEVWKNKIHQEYTNNSSIGASEDVWAWHLPLRTKKEGKEKLFIEVQLVNHYMLDSRHYKIFGFPTVVSLPVAKLAAFPITEFRQILRDGISAYLEGSKFKDGEKDTDLYQVEIMDGRVSNLKGEIELKDTGEINIIKLAGGSGHAFAIGLFWNQEAAKIRFKQDFGKARSSGREKNERFYSS